MKDTKLVQVLVTDVTDPRTACHEMVAWETGSTACAVFDTVNGLCLLAHGRRDGRLGAMIGSDINFVVCCHPAAVKKNKECMYPDRILGDWAGQTFAHISDGRLYVYREA